MTDPRKHLAMLQRRLYYLQQREAKGYVAAEIAALHWAIVNLQPVIDRQDVILQEQLQ